MEGTIITPQVALSEHAEKMRRLRKPTVGELEDLLRAFEQELLQQYGPLAVAIRELGFRVSMLESRGGDTE